jgi:predicted MPP superfamily phosphohydrolase
MFGEGLVQTGFFPVYVTRGLGVITPPVRFGCRPEISLIELVSSSR